MLDLWKKIVASSKEIHGIVPYLERRSSKGTHTNDYPLTLNSLVAACNQKSNRDPVMSLSDDDVAMALESLRGKNLAWQLSTAGGRVPKFEHNLPARLSIAAQDKADAALSDENSQPRTATLRAAGRLPRSSLRKELSVLTSLMLRGPLHRRRASRRYRADVPVFEH